MAILACSIVTTLRSYCFELYTLEFRLLAGTCEMLPFVFGFKVFFFLGGGLGFRVQGSGFRVRVQVLFLGGFGD